MEQEKISAIHIFYKELISKIYKELNIKIPQITQFKKWAKDLNRHFPKEFYKWSTRYVKMCTSPLIIREIQIKTTGDIAYIFQNSVQFSHSVVSDSLQPHGLQAHQASLSITNSWSLLKLMSIESAMLVLLEWLYHHKDK